ncbi:MAG: hypothetical protein E7342_03785 [Clostridiales bacterium]|nr:hypothetical protein [Clostridiales bacterium]
MNVRYRKNTIIYTKGMNTQDCINVIEKRMKKRKEELKIYEFFYKKYVNLQKKQDEDLSWLKHLQAFPNFIKSEKENVDETT